MSIATLLTSAPVATWTDLRCHSLAADSLDIKSLTIEGDAEVKGDLTVDGATLLQEDAAVGGDLSVDGVVTASADITAQGTVTGSSLQSTGTITGQSLTVSQTATAEVVVSTLTMQTASIGVTTNQQNRTYVPLILDAKQGDTYTVPASALNGSIFIYTTAPTLSADIALPTPDDLGDSTAAAGIADRVASGGDFYVTNASSENLFLTTGGAPSKWQTQYADSTNPNPIGPGLTRHYLYFFTHTPPDDDYECMITYA